MNNHQKLWLNNENFIFFSSIWRVKYKLWSRFSAMLLQNPGILRTRFLHLLQSFLNSNKENINRLFLVISIFAKFFKNFCCLLPMVYTKIWYDTWYVYCISVSCYFPKKIMIFRLFFSWKSWEFLQIPSRYTYAKLSSSFLLLESQNLLVSPATKQVKKGHGPFWM